MGGWTCLVKVSRMGLGRIIARVGLGLGKHEFIPTPLYHDALTK